MCGLVGSRLTSSCSGRSRFVSSRLARSRLVSYRFVRSGLVSSRLGSRLVSNMLNRNR